MKHNTGKKSRKKSVRAPSKLTRWAYYMQAIENVSEAINKAFPGYHPQWVIGSQNWSISATHFRYMRKIMLGITQEQCAAYLRVKRASVSQWETGVAKVPFMAFELLRLVYESAHFRTSHPDWDGWFIGKDGQLVSPNIGGFAVTPGEIESISQLRGEINRLKNHNERLGQALEESRQALAEAQAENTSLREMFVTHGVVDEIADMQTRLADLLGRMNTAKVYPFPTTAEQPQKEAAA